VNKPIAIFYHCVFQDTETQMWPASQQVVREQMSWLRDVGLLYNTKELHVGINGGLESCSIVDHLIPGLAIKALHGLQCKNELRTLLMLEAWLPNHPGWNVLYLHSKGATNPSEMSTRWRNCMMRNLVSNWRSCIESLDHVDSVGCHWQGPPLTPPTQHIWAGNFWWATSDYLRTLPSLMTAQRIGLSGVDSVDSRYEAEVWIGNGPKLPTIRDLHPNGLWQCL
jgi:hypothetical protein